MRITGAGLQSPLFLSFSLGIIAQQSEDFLMASQKFDQLRV
jgi:hypothetical protein